MAIPFPLALDFSQIIVLILCLVLSTNWYARRTNICSLEGTTEPNNNFHKLHSAVVEFLIDNRYIYISLSVKFILSETPLILIEKSSNFMAMSNATRSIQA